MDKGFEMTSEIYSKYFLILKSLCTLTKCINYITLLGQKIKTCIHVHVYIPSNEPYLIILGTNSDHYAL